MFRQTLQTGLALSLSTALLAQQATPAPATPAASTTPQAHTLLDGTPVRIRLSQSISSADAKPNQEVPFEVLEELQVDNVVVLPKGAVAIGTVTDAEHKKNMGRGGKLEMNISYARLADGEKVALRAVKEGKGGGHVGAMTGAMVATSLIIWPAAPFFLFVKGKDITIPQGTEITAFVEGDMHLDMTKFGSPAPVIAASPQPREAAQLTNQVTLIVDCNATGADIEVDGNFVGSTPSIVTLPAGPHEITLRKKGYIPWERKMNVTGGTVHITGDMERSN